MAFEFDGLGHNCFFIAGKVLQVTNFSKIQWQ